jgi:hypothetical protein
VNQGFKFESRPKGLRNWLTALTLSPFPWRYLKMLSKGPSETIATVKTRFVGYLRNGQVCFVKQFSGQLQAKIQAILGYRSFKKLLESYSQLEGIYSYF